MDLDFHQVSIFLCGFEYPYTPANNIAQISRASS